MSIESWKKEYYQVDADEFEYGTLPEKCRLHWLRVWQGLRPENLEKHGLKVKEGAWNTYIYHEDTSLENLEKGDSFTPGPDTCAYHSVYGCTNFCPVYILRDMPCHSQGSCMSSECGPYHAWSRRWAGNTPDLMIKLIKDAAGVLEGLAKGVKPTMESHEVYMFNEYPD